MTDVARLFEMAQLSEASYADLRGVITATQLGDALEAIKFSETQASDFVQHWSLVPNGHLPNTSTGYSVTLFQSLDNTNEYVYAIRGTEGSNWPLPAIQDLILTDAGDLVVDGLAIYQIIDMYNHWQRLRAGTGNTYEAARVNVLSSETVLLQAERILIPGVGIPGPYELGLRARNDVIIDDPSGLVITIERGLSTDFFTGDLAVGNVDLPAGANITVTGHSLGGHLASAFTRLFADEGIEAYTFNGAGFPTGAFAGIGGNAETNIRNLFSLLNGADAFTPSAIQNVYGSAWIEVISMDIQNLLSQPGAHNELYTESGLGNTFGHGMGQMTNGLAVFDLFVRISDTYAALTPEEALTQVNGIVRAASHQAGNTFESIVGSFYDIFVNTSGTKTVIPENDREKLYTHLKAIYESDNFLLLEDTQVPGGVAQFQDLSLMSAAETENLALQSGVEALAYRFALVHGSSFVITTTLPIYDIHNSGGALELYDAGARTGTLTDEYIQDRSLYLYGTLQRNVNDASLLPDSLGNVYFEDIASRTQAYSQPQTNGTDPSTDRDNARNYVFGNNENNFIFGGQQADRLYGLGGGDALFHTADGTEDNQSDYLEGGNGYDAYFVGDGDVIMDTDGMGAIVFGNFQLKGGQRASASGEYTSRAGNYTYALTGTTLTVTDTLRNNVSITLENFQNGDLGIELETITPVNYALPETTREINGDVEWADRGIYGFWSDVFPHNDRRVNFDDLSNPIVDPAAPIPTPLSIFSASFHQSVTA